MRISIYILLLIFPVFLHANDGSFDIGNKAYKDGNYIEAIEAYEGIIDDDADGAIHYNLGNAFYKSGDFSKAILYYERALKISPNDPDIIHNLSVARVLVQDKIEPKTEFFLFTWWKELASMQRSNTWTLGFLVFLWAGIFLLIGFILSRGSLKKILFFSGVLSLTLTVVVLLLGITQYKVETYDRGAIILATSVSVKSEPVNSGTDLFIIHEGLKVEVVSQDQDWLRIALADGKEGWIPENALEMI